MQESLPSDDKSLPSIGEPAEEEYFDDDVVEEEAGAENHSDGIFLKPQRRVKDINQADIAATVTQAIQEQISFRAVLCIFLVLFQERFLSRNAGDLLLKFLNIPFLAFDSQFSPSHPPWPLYAKNLASTQVYKVAPATLCVPSAILSTTICPRIKQLARLSSFRIIQVPVNDLNAATLSTVPADVSGSLARSTRITQ